MSDTMAIIFVLVGFAALILAYFGENFEEAGYELADTGRPASKWSGKLIFALVGVAFIAFGAEPFV
jgi:uncharacterized membrane protein YuzA (DUF378 family)